ncbi:stealth conserved region 3 domain-containing protein [Streptomyces omiyaensis]|uniref:Stealth conserved region 3 domain-containing protein n=1 Tax=Streptomyces omiyaensis TaxID=68247 RepID=A0ABW7BWK4_9ACTN|nr:stealth conserved region 3 domain-containing protein [Streptomyces omiyaensis]GGY75656.1 exopolysaccharide phosphotransferase [Streptomyces omiyaensis]
MKVTFLLHAADVLGDPERAVLHQASELAARHEVSVLSLFKARRRRFTPYDGRVPVTFLVEGAGPQQRPVREGGPDEALSAALAARPSELVERRWDDGHNRLSDIEAEYALTTLDTDVLVTTTPGLMVLAARFAPAETLLVHLEQRASEVAEATALEPLLRHTAGFDAVVLPGARAHEWYAETFGAAAPRLQVVPPALPEGFRPRSTLQTRIVTLAARLEENSGVDAALGTWARVSPLHPTWTLRILGDGPLGGALRRRRDQLGLHGTVQLVGEATHPAEEWAKASIALTTTRTDAVGYSLMEAQSAGVPVVGFDSPGVLRDVVADGRTGLLVPVDDTELLADRLFRLVQDDRLRLGLGAAAAEEAVRHAPAEATARWEQLLSALAAERAGGGRPAAKAARTAAQALLGGNDGAARAAAAAPQGTARNRAFKEAEERLLKRDRGLVRDGGQVCRVIDAESPFDIAQTNLALTADALEAAGVPYFLVRDTKIRHSVAVHADYRDAVLKALADRFPDGPVYVGLLNDADTTIATTLAQRAADLVNTECSGIRVYAPVVSATGTLRLGATYGCLVSFWYHDEEEPHFFHSPRRTLIGQRVPRASMRRMPTVLGGRTYPTVEPYTHTLHHDVPFPIDAVYTWVDGSDVNWLERKNAVLASMGIVTEDAATSAARFRNRDELRFSLRSLDMYAPWIRNIYLVTDQQVPPWLDTRHPRVRVVDHTEIFGGEGSLPTYNSHAIESRLHHIDGLAEHFLYFNDDVFAARPIQPSLFFLGNGASKHFMSSNAIPMGPALEGDEFSRIAAKNNRDLIQGMFGQTLVNSFIHAPHPLRRSVMADLETHFPDALRRTAHNRLRDPSDVSVASSLHHYFGYHTGRSVPGRISSGFVNVGLSEQVKKLNGLLASRPNDVFCLNDFHDGDVSEDEQDATLAAFLPSYFPIASQFETGSPRNEHFHAGRIAAWPL